MDSRSPRARAVWRALALAFAIAVVVVRLGIAGCGSAGVGPKRTEGNVQGARQVPAAPASKAPPTAPRPPRIRDPYFLPPTKAGGGFYAPSEDFPDGEAQSPGDAPTKGSSNASSKRAAPRAAKSAKP
jgi:hypothetical protein